MPLLKNKLGAIYVPFLFNPDLILGGLLSVDATFITVDSDIFRADNHYNLTRGPQLILNGNFSQEGSELVTNGDFATDSDWNKQSGWVITNGYAESTALSTRSIYQSIEAPVVGKTYKITYTILETNGGNFKFVYGGVNGTIRNSVGTYTEYIVATSTDGNIYFDALNVMIGKIDNVSVIEVGQNWVFNNSGGSNGWRILDGKAICDASAATPNRNLNSATTLTAGKTYRLNLDILQSEDNMQIVVGNTTLSQTLPTGTHINYEYIIEGSEHNGGIFALYAGSSDLQEVDNISIAEDTTYGPELVSNGDFATDSDWTISGSGVSISGGKLNFVNAASNSEFAQQSIVAPIGKTYKIALDVSNLGSGESIKIRYPFQDITINTNGTHILYGVSDTANAFRLTPNSSTASFSIDNVSVVEDRSLNIL